MYKDKIEELKKTQNWKQIAEGYILPEILHHGGSERNYVISDEYMQLMSEYGAEIFSADTYIAEVLLEFGMQRISLGAVKHRMTSVALAVPQKYVYYSTFQDKPAMMTDACFEFLQDCLPICLKSPKLKKHARLILFGLITNLDYETGAELNGYKLANELLHYPLAEVKDEAWIIGLKNVDFTEFWTELVHDKWTKYKMFFEANWEKIDIRKFHQAVLYRSPAQEAWPDLARDSWERHIAFFHDNWNAVNKDEFFAIIGKEGLWDKAKVTIKIKHYHEKDKESV